MAQGRYIKVWKNPLQSVIFLIIIMGWEVVTLMYRLYNDSALFYPCLFLINLPIDHRKITTISCPMTMIQKSFAEPVSNGLTSRMCFPVSPMFHHPTWTAQIG